MTLTLETRNQTVRLATAGPAITVEAWINTGDTAEAASWLARDGGGPVGWRMDDLFPTGGASYLAPFTMCRVTDIALEAMSDEWTKATITYTTPEGYGLENAHGERVEWSLVAQTTNIKAVKDPALQRHFPPESDTGSAVNVEGENVNGVDVYRTSLSFKVKKHYTDNEMPNQIRAIQLALTTTNNGAFYGFQQGEVLFIGATPTKLRYNDWEICYDFLVSRTQPASSVTLNTGDVVDMGVVLPWQYVWPEMVTSTDETTGAVTRGIKAVHIAQVYDESGAMSMLGLSGSII